jgi:hypothetical protein
MGNGLISARTYWKLFISQALRRRVFREIRSVLPGDFASRAADMSVIKGDALWLQAKMYKLTVLYKYDD